MKIVCDSCGAKYSIADEKVAGKVFKIRCKKCQAVIVVRGDQVAEPVQEDATRVFDYGSDAVWHVVVDGDQQGPFGVSDVSDLLSNGRIDWEAYVWREGFDGWKALRDIPELVEAITGGAAAQSAPAQEPAAQEPAAYSAPAEPATQSSPDASDDPFGGGPDLFAGAAAPAPAGAVSAHSAFSMDDDEATRAVAAPVMGGDAHGANDLFAAPAAGDFGNAAAQAPEGADSFAAIGSPGPAGAASFSGQRNENSVLFSLNNLKALATGGGPEQVADSDSGFSGGPAAAPGPGSGVPVSEGSGLIDIRALASSAAAHQGNQSRNTADALLSIGTGGPALGGGLGAPLLQPVAEPEPEKSKAWIGFAIGGVALAAAAVVGIVVLGGGDDTETVAQNTATPVTTPATAPTPTPEPAPAPTDTAAAAEAEGNQEEEPPAGEAAPEEEAAPAEPATPMTAAERRAAEERRQQAREARAAREASRPSTPPPTMAAERPTPPPTMSGGRSNGNLDDFLNMALSGGGMSTRMAPAPAEMAASNLPQAPSRGQVASALRAVSGRVGRCGGGQGGTVNVRVTVSGRSGRVTGANVSGAPNAGVRSCVSAAVRGARFPRFQQSSFSVTFPFRLN